MCDLAQNGGCICFLKRLLFKAKKGFVLPTLDAVLCRLTGKLETRRLFSRTPHPDSSLPRKLSVVCV